MNRISIFNLLFGVFAFISVLPSPAVAQESSGQFPNGSVIVGYDNRTCNSGLAGSMRYNSGSSHLEYCNGSTWTYPASSGLSGPSGCEDIGDLCADGTVFAGYHPITHEHLFIPTTDQGTTSAWKTSVGTNDIATESDYDGQANSNQVSNSTTFPAFKLCKDLTTGSHSDWYLPSFSEMNYLFLIRTTIESAGNITNFQNTTYWTSTEYNTNNSWTQSFATSGPNILGKTLTYRVRCVRR